MTVIGWLQALVFLGIIAAITKPLGAYMARVFDGERTLLAPIFAPIERAIYRVCRVEPSKEMSATSYLLATLAFSVVGFLYLFVLLRTQKFLPFNPQHFDNLSADNAFNVAASFMTNTNWQFYSGESTMS